MDSGCLSCHLSAGLLCNQGMLRLRNGSLLPFEINLIVVLYRFCADSQAQLSVQPLLSEEQSYQCKPFRNPADWYGDQFVLDYWCVT